MLTREMIKDLFVALNAALETSGEIGEVGIVGGSVMCLVYNVRHSTRDVDAVFEPATKIRELATRVATEKGVDSDWLKDAAKGFLQGPFETQEVLNLSHLRVWAPEPKYMLAMKCMSARWDTHDRDDVIYLIRLLQLSSKDEVFEILESYYPKKQIPTKTQFFIEELFEG